MIFIILFLSVISAYSESSFNVELLDIAGKIQQWTPGQYVFFNATITKSAKRSYRPEELKASFVYPSTAEVETFDYWVGAYPGEADKLMIAVETTTFSAEPAKVCLRKKLKTTRELLFLSASNRGCSPELPFSADEVPRAIRKLAEFPGDFLPEFKPIKKIDSGAIGTVWKVFDTILMKIVALKVPTKASRVGIEREEAFFALMKDKVPGPHYYLEPFRFLNHSKGTWGAVMEYMETDLASLGLGGSRRFRAQDIKVIGKRVLQGIAQIHSQNIIHRDIKPENIVLRKIMSNEAYIIDFDAVCTVNSKSCDGGTAAYLHPSAHMKADGTRPSLKEDIYAFGLTMLALVYQRQILPNVLVDAELEQPGLPEIIGLLGTPTAKFVSNAKPKFARVLANVKHDRRPLWDLILTATKKFARDADRAQFQDMVENCIKWDLDEIPSADELLKHEYFI